MCAFEIKIECPGCCGSAGRYQLQCRSRTGTATLCGWAEFVSPSSPARYYLTGNYAGNAKVEYFSGTGADCAGGGNKDTTTASASGSKTWSPASACVQSSTAKVTWTYDQQSGIPTTDGGVCNVPGSGFGLDFYFELCSSRLAGWSPIAATRTKVSTALWSSFLGVPDAACGCTVFGATATNVDCGNVLTITLADEDTEQSAVSRSSATWGPWQGGTICCTSTGARMGTGSRSFDFTESEYRIRVAGPEGMLINVELTFSRDTGDPYTEIRQFVANSEDFPEGADDGWSDFPITTSPHSTTCLASHRLYVP